MKKLFKLLTVFSSLFLATSLTSCFKEIVYEQGTPGEKGEPGKDGISIKSIVKTDSKDNIDTYTITYSDDSTSFFEVRNGLDGKDGIDGEKGDKGEQGIQGIPGENGKTPDITISSNLTWVIDGVDTNISVQGPKGDKGDQGLPGQDGTNGLNGEKGDKGDQGIQGPQGEKGDKGDQGIQGEAGKDGMQLDEYAKTLTTYYNYTNYKNNVQDQETVDIILFAGQSNMCGRASLDDKNQNGIAYDIPIEEAFTYQIASGLKTTPYKINEPLSQNGSTGYGMIPSFIKGYHEATGRKVCANFCSVGGLMLNKFAPYTFDAEGNKLNKPSGNYTKMVNAVNRSREQLTKSNMKVGKTFLVWCQGESDGSYYGTDSQYCTFPEKQLKTDEEKTNYYINQFTDMFNGLKADCGVEKAGIICIGETNDNKMKHQTIIKSQYELGKKNKDMVLLSTAFNAAKCWKYSDGTTANLMRDTWHYFLEMYNYAGLESGINMGVYLNTNYNVKPILYDYHVDYLKFINKYEKPQNLMFAVDEYLYNPNRKTPQDFM